jgi:hypothetical protein
VTCGFIKNSASFGSTLFREKEEAETPPYNRLEWLEPPSSKKPPSPFRIKISPLNFQAFVQLFL